MEYLPIIVFPLKNLSLQNAAHSFLIYSTESSSLKHISFGYKIHGY
jgi:hypothetical protein